MSCNREQTGVFRGVNSQTECVWVCVEAVDKCVVAMTTGTATAEE